MYFCKKSIISILLVYLSTSCITDSQITPQKIKMMEIREKQNRCLNSLTNNTNGSAEQPTQNTIIYFSSLGKKDILYTPYEIYTLNGSENKSRYCFRLPTDHSIWKVDKSSSDERLTNDDTCGSFVSVEKVVTDHKRYEKDLDTDIENRLVQLSVFTKADDDDSKKLKQEFEELKKICSFNQGE